MWRWPRLSWQPARACRLGMRHVLTGVKREMAKTGKTLLASDFGGYYYLMEEV